MTRCLAATDGLLLLALAAAASPAPTSITLRPTAEVSGAVVLLGDVAQVMPPEAAQALADVDLGPSPGPGVVRTITAGYVKVRLRRVGVNLAATAFAGERTEVSSAPAHAPQVSDARPEGKGPMPGEPSPELKCGGKVTLLVRVGGLQIAAQGEALRPCSVGQEGLFRVCETRTTVMARLLDHESAEVTR